MEVVLQYGREEKTVILDSIPQLRDRVKVGGKRWQVRGTTYDCDGDDTMVIVHLVGGS